jgi:hypothetical protein
VLSGTVAPVGLYLILISGFCLALTFCIAYSNNRSIAGWDQVDGATKITIVMKYVNVAGSMGSFSQTPLLFCFALFCFPTFLVFNYFYLCWFYKQTNKKKIR